jgi:hypothetical protein
MPPKHDLRGGNASEDSFAISSNIFAASMNRCFFAGDHQRVRKGGNDDQISYKNLAQLASHRLMGVVFEERLT